MVAILSDIHSNIHALEAVLSDMPTVSQIWLLGDMVGGVCPFPCQVLDTLMSLKTPTTAVLGNWEAWALGVKDNIDPAWRTAF